ncbi:cysteine/serine-rich nuclear protein 3 isoform X2 [Betta splendens]|nr:cysteine/serine-rich nuclear protein 3 isoform X2 [Betta splendens]XP_028992435.1 cysteine/serine-rich nuclear protein 3 isoform X2 [Betta splendens]XP_028992436.1 cysteine/serine-rich nuclear protein 3 isoform X2 [Betta splendens]XP_028992437.1 cysteine/serine-rich nuclear protein 3 isoform X2 [Betta splendens]XP_040924673.1 cysteine/serine-rich nuclear protein 3 isoform X2 [Betta splendens]XP_040924674.1 cysteine/serine-rich nuclear protein 3 isoform X2 [Betta splendens]
MSGILKRKFEEVEAASSPCSSLRESDDEVSCSESGNSSDSVNPSASGSFTPDSILKREKRLRTRRVHFENVTVYYFGRRQGFTSVPSQGGSTLGMSNRHSWVRQYSLGEFALEQERLHRDMLRDHLKEEKLNSIKLKLTKNGTVESEEASALTADDISDDDIDLDNTEVDEYFFLQPLTTKKRRALLRSSGVKKIDVEEKHELRTIRMSREDCGCDCRVFCDPETCACSIAGIKCQVDRMSFPCGCTKEGCSNATGRVEFNPIRVRTHFLHTIMKLELEKSREQQQVSPTNGYKSEAADLNPLVQSQHRLEYALSDAVPQTTSMHLQADDDMDGPLDAEDEDEDEDDDDEEENEDDEEDEEDSSSVCSGLSDSSTQSLANSDSEDDDEEEDEDDDDKSENLEDATAPSASRTEVVPLSSGLCYSDGSVAREAHMNGNGYLMNSPPADYYQLESSGAASNGPAGQSGDSYGEALAFEDSVANGNVAHGAFGGAAGRYADYPDPSEEQYTQKSAFTLSNGAAAASLTCYGPDQENKAPSKAALAEPPGTQSQTQFQNYLTNNAQSSYNSNGSFATTGPAPNESSVNGHPDLGLIANGTKSRPLSDHCPEVAAI